MGSCLRNLRTTTVALPTSSLIGVDSRLRNRLTYRDATAAKTSTSARETTVNKPNRPVSSVWHLPSRIPNIENLENSTVCYSRLIETTPTARFSPSQLGISGSSRSAQTRDLGCGELG